MFIILYRVFFVSAFFFFFVVCLGVFLFCALFFCFVCSFVNKTWFSTIHTPVNRKAREEFYTHAHTSVHFFPLVNVHY